LFYSLVNGGRGTLNQNRREGANNFGVFAQEEVHFGEIFSVLVGARYDNITYYSEDYLKPGFTDTRSFTQMTPKFGLTYRVTPEQTLYANVGGGVEVPAGNETNPPSTFGEDTLNIINTLLEPIRSTTVEAGYKTATNADILFGEAHITADVAAYLISITNDVIPYRGGRFYFTAGESRRLGGELGLGIRWENGLSLYGSGTYCNNTYVKYTVDSMHYDKSAAGKFMDFAGKNVAGLPEFFSSLRIRYEPEAVKGLFVEAEMRMMGEYFADDANTLTVPSFTVFDATAGYELKLSDAFSAKAYVRMANLADTKYVASAWINPDRPASVLPAYLEPGLPSNFTGGLTVSWSPAE
jgi:iron complex outermembrane receptor protein